MPPKTSNVFPFIAGRGRRSGAAGAKIQLPAFVPPDLDLSHLDAATVITRNHKKIRVVCVGAGGSGSFVAYNVCRLAAVLEEAGREVEVVIVDPDRVSESNVPRSNFSESEIGMPKAQALQIRFSRAWGVRVTAVNRKFHSSLLWQSDAGDCLTVIVGAVDNAAARRSINRAFTGTRSYEGRTPDTWWCDLGNDRETGQVLLGSATSIQQLRGSFALEGLCQSLPSPVMQSPDLLREIDEGPKLKKRLSCLELMLMQEQSLMINQRMANEAGEMLAQLLLYRNLQRFATFVDTRLGVQTSEYTTPEHVARAVRRKRTDFLLDASAFDDDMDVMYEEAA
ncbi:MAG: ThiF family adenylyltransferase [Pyrinomonadaceae bacterium]